MSVQFWSVGYKKRGGSYPLSIRVGGTGGMASMMGARFQRQSTIYTLYRTIVTQSQRQMVAVHMPRTEASPSSSSSQSSLSPQFSLFQYIRRRRRVFNAFSDEQRITVRLITYSYCPWSPCFSGVMIHRECPSAGMCDVIEDSVFSIQRVVNIAHASACTILESESHQPQELESFSCQYEWSITL